jgi:hypothetical protein
MIRITGILRKWLCKGKIAAAQAKEFFHLSATNRRNTSPRQKYVLTKAYMDYNYDISKKKRGISPLFSQYVQFRLPADETKEGYFYEILVI